MWNLTLFIFFVGGGALSMYLAFFTMIIKYNLFLCFSTFKMSLVYLICSSILDYYDYYFFVLVGFWGFFSIPLLPLWWCFRSDQKSHCIFSICSAGLELLIFISFYLFQVLSSHFFQTSMTAFMTLTPESSLLALIYPEFMILYINLLQQSVMRVNHGNLNCILTRKEPIILFSHCKTLTDMWLFQDPHYSPF